MNPEIKQLWIAALESGEYTQGRFRLCTQLERDVREYCCLGVLCDLYKKQTGNGRWIESSENIVAFAPNNDSPTNYIEALPYSVVRWAGLTQSDPLIGIYRATNLNDVESWTFAEIAAEIRSEL